MPTRNEQKRATLTRRKNVLEGKILPLTREIAYIDGQIELLDQYEAAEIQEAQEKIGLIEGFSDKTYTNMEKKYAQGDS